MTDTITAPDVEAGYDVAAKVAAGTAVVRNPYTGEVIASVPNVGAEAVDGILKRVTDSICPASGSRANEGDHGGAGGHADAMPMNHATTQLEPTDHTGCNLVQW